MGQIKSLIGGNEKGEDRIYPPNWPCAFCKRPQSKHSHFLNVSGIGLRNWCYKRFGEVPNNQQFSQIFKPMDNLEYVEYLAKNKEL